MIVVTHITEEDYCRLCRVFVHARMGDHDVVWYLPEWLAEWGARLGYGNLFWRQFD